MIFILIIIFPLIVYIFGLILFVVGNLKPKQNKEQKFQPNVSVIVAIRDGENSIKSLLDCLNSQIYKSKIDFILVDDQSTDKTKDIIIEFCKERSNFKYVSSTEGNQKYKYKKKALDAGIKHAKYELLLFTDVDCRPTQYWVSSMASNFDNNVDYIIGPATVKNPKSLVSLYQSIDLDILMASLNGITSLGLPCAASGQNQGFRKSIYYKVCGYDKIKNLLGGDDSIFLNIVRRNFGKIKFVNAENALVFSRHENTIKNLINQRIRWAIDGNLMYKYNFVFYILIVCTLIANLIFLISPLLYVLTAVKIQFFILVKFLFELLLFQFSKSKLSFINFLFWFLIQPLYVVVIGLNTILAKNISWRNRKYVN